MAVIGFACKLFRGTAGTTGSTAMNNVKDATLNISCPEADITTRGASGWKVSEVTLKEASVTFTMLYDPDDADFTAIQTAFFSNTAIALFASDGVGTTSTACNGLDGDWKVTSFVMNQSLEDAVTVDIECKPTNIGGSSGRNPTWKTATT